MDRVVALLSAAGHDSYTLASVKPFYGCESSPSDSVHSISFTIVFEIAAYVSPKESSGRHCTKFHSDSRTAAFSCNRADLCGGGTPSLRKAIADPLGEVNVPFSPGRIRWREDFEFNGYQTMGILGKMEDVVPVTLDLLSRLAKSSVVRAGRTSFDISVEIARIATVKNRLFWRMKLYKNPRLYAVGNDRSTDEEIHNDSGHHDPENHQTLRLVQVHIPNPACLPLLTRNMLLISQDGDEPSPCSICLEECDAGSEVCRLQCSHVFHKDCVVTWLKRGQGCPLCRSDIPECNYIFLGETEAVRMSKDHSFSLRVLCRSCGTTSILE